VGGQTLASLTAALFLCPLSEWDPQYTSQEQAWFETEGGNGHIAIPESLAPIIVNQFHEGTHSVRTALETTLAQHFYVPKLQYVRVQSVCHQNNP
jgi:hypothetical protein